MHEFLFWKVLWVIQSMRGSGKHAIKITLNLKETPNFKRTYQRGYDVMNSTLLVIVSNVAILSDDANCGLVFLPRCPLRRRVQYEQTRERGGVSVGVRRRWDWVGASVGLHSLLPFLRTHPPLPFWSRPPQWRSMRLLSSCSQSCRRRTRRCGRV